MKKFAKSLMLTLTALCLSVCFLFAGCSKYQGEYVFSKMTYSVMGIETTKTAEDVDEDYMILKLSLGNKLEIVQKDGNTTKTTTGSWEEVEKGKLKIVIDENEQTVEADGETLTITLLSLGSFGNAKITFTKK